MRASKPSRASGGAYRWRLACMGQVRRRHYTAVRAILRRAGRPPSQWQRSGARRAVDGAARITSRVAVQPSGAAPQCRAVRCCAGSCNTRGLCAGIGIEGQCSLSPPSRRWRAILGRLTQPRPRLPVLVVVDRLGLFSFSSSLLLRCPRLRRLLVLPPPLLSACRPRPPSCVARPASPVQPKAPRLRGASPPLARHNIPSPFLPSLFPSYPPVLYPPRPSSACLLLYLD